MHYFIIAIGGMFGAVSRAFICSLLAEKSAHFPIATLTVNLLGCFLMGLVIEIFAIKTTLTPDIKLFLTTGFLGAFTTFSAFGLDIVTLIQKGLLLNALLYAISSVVCGVIGIYLAIYLVHLFGE